MKQRTIKEIHEALWLIHDKPHHRFVFESEPGQKPHHLTLDNPSAGRNNFRIRIPTPIWYLIWRRDWIRLQMRAYDTRMYALTQKGRRYLKRRGFELHE